MIYLDSLGLILDDEKMVFYLADANFNPSIKLDYDYRTVMGKAPISEEDMRTVNYYGELYEAKEDMDDAIEEAKEVYRDALKVIKSYYKNFKIIK